MPTDTQKLRVIRSRTDHDLLVLVNRELDRAFALVNVTPARNSPLFAQAGKAYETAMTLLSRIASLDQGDRLRIDGRLVELRTRLDQVPVCANLRPYLASAAS